MHQPDGWEPVPGFGPLGPGAAIVDWTVHDTSNGPGPWQLVPLSHVREAGRVCASDETGDSEHRTMPRTVHQTAPVDRWLWDPSWVEAQSSWQRACSEFAGCRHLFWDDAALREAVAALTPEYLAVYDGYPLQIHRVDFARPVLLLAYGGAYADMDVAAVHATCPLALVPPSRPIMIEACDWASSLMISPAGHPFWRHVLDATARRALSGTANKEHGGSDDGFADMPANGRHILSDHPAPAQSGVAAEHTV